MASDSDTVDIRINDAERQTRADFKRACDEQDCTYPEMLKRLVRFYEQNRDEFEAANLTTRRRRR